MTVYPPRYDEEKPKPGTALPHSIFHPGALSCQCSQCIPPYCHIPLQRIEMTNLNPIPSTVPILIRNSARRRLQPGAESSRVQSSPVELDSNRVHKARAINTILNYIRGSQYVSTSAEHTIGLILPGAWKRGKGYYQFRTFSRISISDDVKYQALSLHPASKYICTTEITARNSRSFLHTIFFHSHPPSPPVRYRTVPGWSGALELLPRSPVPVLPPSFSPWIQFLPHACAKSGILAVAVILA